MLDRLDADAVSLSFGGLKNTVLLPDFAVIGILHFDQKQPLGMQICSDFDLPPVLRSTDTGFERIFQQVGQDQTHVDLIDRKSLRQIELCIKGNAFALCQGTIITDDAICCMVSQKCIPRSGMREMVFQGSFSIPPYRRSQPVRKFDSVDGAYHAAPAALLRWQL